MKVALAVFAYNRPAHLQRALASLSRCAELNRLSVHIFCDGAKKDSDVEAVAETWAVADRWAGEWGASVHKSPENFGLAASIMGGVSALLADADAAIVVEDDLGLHPSFLDFHLRSLARYAHEERVMQITGFRFSADDSSGEVGLTPIMSTWGWSTWKRAWEKFQPLSEWPSALNDEAVRERFDLEGVYPYSNMLRNRLAGANDSWGIFWYWHIFSANGLIVYPPISLTENLGFDGSGVHCGDREGRGEFAKGKFLDAVADDLDKWIWPAGVEVSGPLFQKFLEGIAAARGKSAKPRSSSFERRGNSKDKTFRYGQGARGEAPSQGCATGPKTSVPVPAGANHNPYSAALIMWKRGVAWLAKIRARASQNAKNNPEAKASAKPEPKPAKPKYTCGENTEIRGGVERRAKEAKIVFGRDCLIEGRVVAEASDSRVTIGDNVFIGGGTLVDCTLSITIEDDVLISYGGVIADSDNHDIRYSIRKHDLKAWRSGGYKDWDQRPRSAVLIKKGAWVGARVIILKGVTIGEGAVIGAGSVVTKNVPDWTVAAGNPARVIRQIPEGER